MQTWTEMTKGIQMQIGKLSPLFPLWLKPNHFTLARLFLVLPTALLIWQGSYCLGLICHLFGWWLDLFDGIFARSRNLTSRLGAVLDPFADKCSIISALWLLLAPAQLLWFLVVALTVIEVFLFITRPVKYLLKKMEEPKKEVGADSFKANNFGKLKTIPENLAVIFALVALFWENSAPSNLVIGFVNYLFLPLSIFLALASLVWHFRKKGAKS